MRVGLRRVACGVGAVALLASTFTLGVVAGAGSQPQAATPPTGVLDQAASEISDDGLHPVDRSVLDAAAIKAMLAAADDQWGSWGDGATTQGSYAGVGLWLRRAGSEVLVAQVAAGGPAEAAGVQVGDRLTTVDGRSVTGLSATDAAAALRGKAGTTVVVALE